MPDDDSRSWAGRRPDTPNLNESLRAHARQMRSHPTPAERRLWRCLRQKQFKGYKFRRQHVVGQFIVDFYCAEARLVIELDGESHRYTGEHDAFRQAVLEGLGLRVLRFANDDVMKSLEFVLAAIELALPDT
jgi:very-short-patch-repair endonuclease